jgi:DNA-binding transcriptional LysR family regulator
VELRELRTFLVVAEELHFARAAERLGITASAVSQTIPALESCLAVRLFERGSRRVRLTPTGQGLLAEISPQLAALEEILVRTRHSAGLVSGRLRLATMIRPDSRPGPDLRAVLEEAGLAVHGPVTGAW